MTVDRLLLWRHGRTEWNAGGRFQGQQDTPLDAVGIAQAKEAAPYLAAEKPTAIYSSDLSRAQRTAQVLADLTGLDLQTDPRLRETSLGGWEGLDRDQVAEKFPDEYAAWRSGAQTNPGNGETAPEVADRTAALVEEIIDAGDGTVVLVAHGGALKALTARLIQMPEPTWSLIAPLRNCHWTELRLTDNRQWRLHGHNLYQLTDPSTLTHDELNVDSDAGDTRIGPEQPSSTDAAGAQQPAAEQPDAEAQAPTGSADEADPAVTDESAVPAEPVEPVQAAPEPPKPDTYTREQVAGAYRFEQLRGGLPEDDAHS